MTLKERLIAAHEGKAILFCGAGCSIDSLNFGLTAVPTVNPLLTLFNQKLEKNIQSIDVAAGMLQDRDPKEYFKVISTTFHVRSVPNDFVDIARFPWSRVYTTNYDNAIELAFARAGKDYRPLTALDDLEKHPTDATQIVHLHGFVERFDIENISRDCILDFNSNVANRVYDGIWGDALRNDFIHADIVVFIGYSLYDPDISKLIRSSGLTREKIFFVNSSNQNDELEYRQKHFGTPLAIQRDGFAAIANSASKQSKKSGVRRFVCFSQSRGTAPAVASVTQSNLEALFVYGNLDENLLRRDLTNSTEEYAIDRACVRSAITALETSQFIILYGSLGHGKSVAAKMLLETVNAGGRRRAFFAQRDQPEFLEELNEIVDSVDRPVIIIEDIFKFKKYWRALAGFGAGKLSIIATSRYNIFQARELELEEAFAAFSPTRIRVGDLDEAEADALVPLITQVSLWGEFTKLGDAEKSKLIRGIFRGNFADILIGLLKSTDLIARFRKELTILKELSPACYDGVLLTIYLEFIGQMPDVTLLEDGYGSDLTEFANHPELSSFFRVFLVSDRHGIRYASSIFSKFALEEVCDADDLLKVIEVAIRNLSSKRLISGDYYHTLRELMRFNYLKSLCGDGDFDRLFNLYDRLSSEKVFMENDLFWLQFGMLERQRGRYSQARKHLVTSKGYAQRRGGDYEPFQTDNQLIACILEAAIFESNTTTDQAFRDLKEVCGLLTSQLKQANKSSSNQAFQWLVQIQQFFDKFMLRFGKDQRSVAVGLMNRYSSRIQKDISNWHDRAPAANTVEFIASLSN